MPLVNRQSSATLMRVHRTVESSAARRLFDRLNVSGPRNDGQYVTMDNT